MARYTGAVCRQCRREGLKLFLKGDRCYSEKCSVDRRSFPPGQHGTARSKKMSEYGMQMREKQKVRRYYGVLEAQFRRYFEIAAKTKGVTGGNLLAMLESRLDNIVFRLGFAMSRPEARQLVRHGHFTVDGRKVDIPSFQVKPGQVVALRERSRSSAKIKSVLEANGSKTAPSWLSFDKNKLVATILTTPDRSEIEIPIQEHLIVELYSK